MESIEKREVGGAAVLYLLPDKDGAILADELIANVRRELAAFIQENEPKRLVISFDRVVRSGSELIGIVAGLVSKVRPFGGSINVCGMNANVLEGFTISNVIPNVFSQQFASASDAANAFK